MQQRNGQLLYSIKKKPEYIRTACLLTDLRTGDLTLGIMSGKQQTAVINSTSKKRPYDTSGIKYMSTSCDE